LQSVGVINFFSKKISNVKLLRYVFYIKKFKMQIENFMYASN
jgi:hypothetical protein